jgi:hypothetical protein
MTPQLLQIHLTYDSAAPSDTTTYASAIFSSPMSLQLLQILRMRSSSSILNTLVFF